MKKLWIVLSVLLFGKVHTVSFEGLKGVIHDVSIEQRDAAVARTLNRLATMHEKGFKGHEKHANWLRAQSEVVRRHDLSPLEKLELQRHIKECKPDVPEPVLKNGFHSVSIVLIRIPMVGIGWANAWQWSILAKMTQT